MFGQSLKGEYKDRDILFSLEGVPLVKEFVDRPLEMEKLEENFFSAERSDRRKVVILSGMGGIGKTQLSVEFARKHQRRYSAVIWLDGRTKGVLEQSIIALASRIPKHQIPDLSQTDRNIILKHVLDWFSAPDNSNWLMIFDNVDEDYEAPEAGASTRGYIVDKYFPGADHGSILITTRLDNLGQIGREIRVGTVDKKQAIAIFQSGYGRELEGMR